MSRVVTKVLLVACAVLLLLPVGSVSARADEEGESNEAKELVQQAIALIVNTPDDEMAIEERINDALEAPDTEGTDPAIVERAMNAFASGEMDRTRSLLQTAIGAGSYLGEGVPPEVGKTTGKPGQAPYAVGEETGTVVVLDELDPDGDLDGADPALLTLSGLAIVGGLLLAWRFRPADTIRQMRHASQTEGPTR